MKNIRGHSCSWDSGCGPAGQACAAGVSCKCHISSESGHPERPQWENLTSLCSVIPCVPLVLHRPAVNSIYITSLPYSAKCHKFPSLSPLSPPLSSHLHIQVCLPIRTLFAVPLICLSRLIFYMNTRALALVTYFFLYKIIPLYFRFK